MLVELHGAPWSEAAGLRAASPNGHWVRASSMAGLRCVGIFLGYSTSSS
jgi:hypothetical protein